MGSLSAAYAVKSAKTVRNELRLTETDFGEVLTDIARKLYPPPNSAAQIAAELGCSVRLIELYFEGRQKWSGDAVAFFVAEICRRHRMRNVRVRAR